MVILQHTKKLDDGRFRYRRRYPENARAELGWEFIPTSDTPLSEKGCLRWHQDREAEFDTVVRLARRLTAPKTATDMELYEAAQARARRLLEGVVGLGEDDARATLAEGIAMNYPEDPETGDRVDIGRVDAAIIAALMDTKLTAPEPTMADAKRLYLSERVGDLSTERGRKNLNDTDRVFRLAEEALGDRAKLPLSKLADADARAVRDHMLKRARNGKAGETVKASSARRELNILASAWKVALKGFDLNKGAKAVNIFGGLSIPQEGAQSQQDERHPLPYQVIKAMWTKLRTAREKKGGALPQLRLIWRLLAGTGCRESEIAGLRVKD